MIPEDQIRFLIGLIACIPVGILMRNITDYSVRKYVSLITAVIIQYYVYRSEIFLALFLHVVIYLLIIYKGRKCGFFITAISMLGLLAYHINRLLVAYGSYNMDLSMILMLFVAKYSLFAYAYEDGGVDVDKLKHKYQKQERIEVLPSFIDYLGYLQFAPSCVLNTPIDYRKYMKYMKSQGKFSSIPIKECFEKCLKDFGIGIVCALIYVCQMLLIPMPLMREQAFLEKSTLYIIAYTTICIWLLKFRYYFAWKISMLSIHASGISYEPSKDEKGDNFLGVQTCNPWEIQTTIHLREKINNWNITVQEWLRKCVYDRLGFSKDVSQLCTFLVSAFWHGAYGGYYLSFFIWFIQLYVSGIVYKFSQYKKNPVYKMYSSVKPYSYWLIWLFWNALFSFNGMYFHLLSAQTGLAILGELYYIPFIFMILTGLFFKFIPKNSSEKEDKNPTKTQ